MNPNSPLTTKVDAIKLIARNALRMELISPRLSTIASLENEVKSVNDTITEINHEIDVENYEILKLDINHPNYTKTKTSKEEEVKALANSVTSYNKQIEVLNKAITEQKDGIAKIESGETKVCLESLNELVSKLLLQDAKNQINS